MKNCLSFFLLLFIFHNQLASQINKIIPDWVKLVDVRSVTTIDKNQIKNGFYYLLLDEQYNTIKKQNYFHYASMAITEEALTNVAQIEFSYDPSYETANLHFVKIHRGNQIIDKTSTLKIKVLNEENERKSGILNGNKTLYINLTDVRKDDIVEYSYSRIGRNPIMKDYFNINLSLSYSDPVGKIHLRVIFPKSTTPNILYENCTIQPEIKNDLFNDYTWQSINPKVVILESSTPSSYNPFQLVQISNLKNWEQVKDHYKTLLIVPNYNNLNLKKIIDSITHSTSDLNKQITSIIEFVQTHIRYSGNEYGIYSHMPRSPEVVIKNRFGDCKEKAVLLNEMLKLINIEAFPVLINTSLGNKILQKNPAINSFDHCITVFKYNNQLYFIDPTISYQRGDFIFRKIPRYEVGMILDNNKKVFVNITDDLESKCDIKEEFVIEKSGDTKLKVTSHFTGTNADNIRYVFLTNSIYDVQEEYKKYYSKYSNKIDIIDSIKFIDNEGKNEFTIIEYYRLNKFWKASDSTKSKIIEKDFIPYSLNEKLTYGEEDKRSSPLKISFPLNYTQTISINKEDGGWNVKNSIKTANNKYFEYTYSTKLEGKTVNLKYNYISKVGIVEPEDYLDFKDKMSFIDYNMVFNTSEKPLTDGIIGFNWSLVLTILVALLISGLLIFYLYKKPHESIYVNRYNSIGGWLYLVGISVTITPIYLLFFLYNTYHSEFGVNYSVFFFNAKSDFFAPMLGYYTFFTAFMNTFMLVFSIFLVLIFHQKKSSFRLYFPLFRIFNSAFLIVNVIVLYVMYSDATDIEERTLLSEQTSSMFKSIIHTCIWGSYVWFSDRSKETFTNETPSILGFDSNENDFN